MKVGFTYDLRDEYLAAGFGEEETAELDKIDTIEGIESALRELGYPVDRIGNARTLAARLVSGDRWDMVFNIAEGISGTCRESQVPVLLELYNIPYTFSDARVLAITLDKVVTKRMVAPAGVPTAAFVEIREPGELASVALRYPLFAKPVAEGTGKGITERSFIRTAAELQQTVGEMLATCRQPVLVEEYLPGDEFTVGVIGTGASARVVGVMQIHYRSEVKQIYSYATKKDYEERVDYSLVKPGPVYDACVAVVLRAWRTLDCRDGGRVDLRMDAAGVPNFIEVNPLAGLNPTHSDLPILCRLGGTSYVQLIGMIMESALTRLPVAAPI